MTRIRLNQALRSFKHIDFNLKRRLWSLQMMNFRSWIKNLITFKRTRIVGTKIFKLSPKKRNWSTLILRVETKTRTRRWKKACKSWNCRTMKIRWHGSSDGMRTLIACRWEEDLKRWVGRHLLKDEVWNSASQKWKSNFNSWKLKSCEVKRGSIVKGYDEEVEKEGTWVCRTLGHL